MTLLEANEEAFWLPLTRARLRSVVALAGLASALKDCAPRGEGARAAAEVEAALAVRVELSAAARLICEISMRREVSETREASWVPIMESWLVI